MLAAIPFFSLFAACSDSSVAYPNPLITEIHFNVRADCDATGDGNRDAVGDEFVELINPHDKPIRLRGFTLVDSDAFTNKSASRGGRDKGDKNKAKSQKDDDAPKAGEARQVRFTFPELELKPGQVAVVFNGYKQQIPGSVGSEEKAQGPNENFHDAFVFSMRIGSKYAAFDNNGDWVALLDPAGKAVQLVRWGKPKEKEPTGVALVEDAPESDGSAQRDGLGGKFKPHDALKGYEKLLFSPGRFDFPGRSTNKNADGGDAGEQPKSESERKPEKKRP